MSALGRKQTLRVHASTEKSLSIERAVRTPYRHDSFQPRYLVSGSLDRTVEDVLSLTAEELLAV
jgi:phenylalanine-4-hydroxylase